MKTKPVAWTLNEALAYIKEVHFKFREINFWLALGGSVLICGQSIKDLDIVLMNMNNGTPDWGKVDDLLFSLGFKIQDDKYEETPSIRKYATGVPLGMPANKIIDWFIYPE